MGYTDLELQKILEQVETEFSTHLAKKEEELKLAELAKSEKPFPPKDEKKPEEKEEEKKPEDKPEDKKPEGDHKEESKEESKEEQKPSEDKPKDPQQSQEDEGHGYDDEDMEHMHKMYMSMSKAELKAHHDCIAGIAKCGDMGMAKSETSTSIEVKVPEVSIETSLLKSELEAAKAKTAELQKKVDLATDFFGKLNAKKSAPQGKAITSLDVIAKSEESKVEKNLSMSEVTSILAKKSADPSLSKSDRDAINEFYLGSKNIQLVRHLLT